MKPGSVQRVIRPEGKVRHPSTNRRLGVYYKDVGSIRVEAVDQKHATARLLTACEGLLKGDIVVAGTPKPPIKYSGSMSNDLTPLPRGGISSSIFLAKDDARELATGHFCFILAGKRQGVQPGDRFTIFRPHPKFNGNDMVMAGTAADSTYDSMRGGFYSYRIDTILKARTLPPRILGDIVIVEVGEGTSTGKIVNSLSEIHPGDLVVKR